MIPGLNRVTWRGFKMTARTRDMLKWAEAQSGVPIALAQGSYNPGGVGASGGTHDREAIDLRIRQLSTGDRVKLVRALKDAGFAAWHRTEVPGLWGPHIHAVPIGGDLAPSAAQQVRAYDLGRDGLRGNRIDKTYRPVPKVKWDYRLGKPVRRR